MLSSLLATTLAVATIVTTAAGQDGSVGYFTPAWRFSADALIMGRSDSNFATVILDTATGTPVFNTSQIDLGADIGPMLQLVRTFESGWGLDVRYFGLDNWNDSYIQTAAPGQQFLENFNGLTFGDIDQFETTYGSDLHSLEANLRREWGESVTVFAGYRMLELDEFFRIQARNVLPQDPSIEESQTRSTNYLYGFQLGAETLLIGTDNFRLDVTGRAGVFGNHVSQTMFVRDNGFEYPVQTLSDDEAAFVGDLVFTGALRLTDYLSLRGGAQFMWVDGVALAPEQTQVNDFRAGTYAIDNDDDVFYYGGFAGLELEL
jgi:hypothetical protein